MSKKADGIRAQIEELQSQLEKLESLPDLDEMHSGTVIAVAVSYPSGLAYQYVALKVENLWYFTGKGPNAASGDEVTAWLTAARRKIIALEVIAELTVVNPIADLNQVLQRIRSAMSATSTTHSYPVWEW